MDNEFYVRKIKQLTDDRLKELIGLKTNGNQEIIEIAEKEASDRGIDLDTIDAQIIANAQKKNRTNKDDGINWMGVIADFLNGVS